MLLVNWWKVVVLQRYAQFIGRAGRAEYWWFFLASQGNAGANRYGAPPPNEPMTV